MNETTNINISIPICGILGIVFIVLKLTHVIAWSWLWVLAPFWIPLAIFIIFMIITVIVIHCSLR